MRSMEACRVRTITVFVGLTGDEMQWKGVLEHASVLLAAAQDRFEREGFTVQTTRVATNPYPEYTDPKSAVASLHTLDELCQQAGIDIAAAGPGSSPGDLKHCIVPALAAGRNLHLSFRLPRITHSAAGLASGRHQAHAASASATESEQRGSSPLGDSAPGTTHSCSPGAAAASESWPWSGGMGSAEAQAHYAAAAEAILDIADATGGAANFNFCVTANCGAGVPFFPAATAESGWPGVQGFAVGLENDGLLSRAAAAGAAADADGPTSPALQSADGCAAAQADWAPARAHSDAGSVSSRIAAAFTPVMERVEAICKSLAHETGVQYLGIDTSVVPGLDTPRVTDSLSQLMGGLPFGGPGSIAVCAAATQALKTLPVLQTGYCGIMLPVCEDEGLAAAAKQGCLTMQKLLTYSSVCGVGLDTVPVPGRSGERYADRALARQIEMLLMDTASLAFRLDKPLSVRLLPQPGKRTGDAATFDSPYLIGTTVMAMTD